MSPEVGIIIGLALAVAAVLVVTRPLRQPASTAILDETQLADLLIQRDAAYQALRDLDSDFNVGKLSEDDYRPMRVQALAHAAEIVAQLDAYRQAAADKAQIPLKKVRRKAQSATKPELLCPQCATPHAPDDAFCRKCGRALQVAEQNLKRANAKSAKGK